MNTEQEFATKDFGLATSLMADGIKYLRVEKDDADSRRLIFIFEKSDEISRIESQRANGNHIVSSTTYEDCQRRLKSIIHSNR